MPRDTGHGLRNATDDPATMRYVAKTESGRQDGVSFGSFACLSATGLKLLIPSNCSPADVFSLRLFGGVV